MDNTVSTAALQRLLGVGKPALTELAARGIVKCGPKRGTFELEASVLGCAHLCEEASARAERAAQMHGRGSVRRRWTSSKRGRRRRGASLSRPDSKDAGFRNRVLAVPHRLRDLTARQTVALTHFGRADRACRRLVQMAEPSFNQL